MLRKEDQKEYALKKVKMIGLSEKEKENSINEVRIIASIRNPNIIQYKEAFIDEPSNSLWYINYLIASLIYQNSIVMEFCNNGDLFQKVQLH